MTEIDPRIGLLVGGKYRILELLGSGGMGGVYVGRDEELGGAVAVKFLHRSFGQETALRARFRREAQALSRLRHPGVVSLLHFGEHDEELFVVMELVSGRPLSQVIDAESPLALPFVVTVFAELLAVLEFAHGEGVVHRDVKPSNVMILPGDRVKLIDFGLVRLPEAPEKLTRAGVAQGTPEYMSPEQSQGESVEAASDVYSAAVLLYECIAGTGPFDGDSAALLMTQHLFVDPPPLKTRGHKRDVPAALESIVRRALSKKPHERPTAGAMRAELLAFAKGTDTVTLNERGAEARQRDATLDRDQRAPTGRPAPPEASPPPDATVLIRVNDPARATALRSALGARGLPVAAHDVDPASATGALVVSAADGLATLGRPGVPVLVVDVDGADATVAAIRAGASDIAMKGADDSRIAAQVARLLRRKR